MFEREPLEALLALQRRTYRLLGWVNERAKAGRLPLDALHGALDESRAAAEWLRRNAATLPPDARPPEGALERYAHLFASYLVTSFEVAPTWRRRASCGCRFCAYLVNAPNLRARAPSADDERIAGELVLDCLEALAAEEGLPFLRAELAPLATVEEVVRPLALIAWTRELARRAGYRGQGRPVLALWRTFAWRRGRPDRTFEVTADGVLRAEAAVRARLRAAAT